MVNDLYMTGSLESCSIATIGGICHPVLRVHYENRGEAQSSEIVEGFPNFFSFFAQSPSGQNGGWNKSF